MGQGLGLDGHRLHDWLQAGDVSRGSHRPVESLRVYGTDIGLIGNSVRRTYDLTIVEPNDIAGTTKKEE